MKGKLLQLIIAIMLIMGAIYYLEGQKVSNDYSGESVEIKQGKYATTPELVGISGYLNTDGKEIKISDFRGKVVLIDFWTYSCINCIRTLPHLVMWDSKYKDEGLVIIGVHTPEFDFEKSYDNVKMAIEKYNIEYAVVQDNNYATWSVFKNRYWPRKYLIDKDGFIRYDHIGEGAYDETERIIQELLAETGKNISNEINGIPDTTPRRQLTPELYAGYDFALPRGQDVGNLEKLEKGVTKQFTPQTNIDINKIYLSGMWKTNSDNLQAQDDMGASIILGFTASDVNIVADSLNGKLEVEVFINDEYVSKEQAGTDVQFIDNKSVMIVDEPRLYNVIHGDYGTYKLKLVTTSKEFTFHAFTFG